MRSDGMERISKMFKCVFKNYLKAFGIGVIAFLICFFSSASGFAQELKKEAPGGAAKNPGSSEPSKESRNILNGKIESVLKPENPGETVMIVSFGDSDQVELILSSKTRFYPVDYYPCEGDQVRVGYAVIGVFKKRVIAYSVSLIEEFSGINRESYKIKVNK